MPESTIYRHTYEAMSTTFELIAYHNDSEYVRQASQAVFAEITRLENLLSKFNTGTDLSQVNRLKPGESLNIAMEVHECLALAGKAYVETDGAFDIAYESRRHGDGTSALEFLMLSDPEEPVGPGESPYFAGISPEAADHGFAGAYLDLGGIGKGYALDKCAEILSDWDFDNFLLNSGTSTVLAIGVGPDGEGWPVGIAGDYSDIAGMDLVYLKDTALSGSGTAVKGAHIKNPHTGSAADAHICAWAEYPSAALSDAYSTAFMLLNDESCEKIVSNTNNLKALTVSIDQNGFPHCMKKGF